MTNVQFYILASANQEDRWAYARRLVVQTLMRGKTVHVHTSCAADTRHLINYLLDADTTGGERITIDHKGEPDHDPQVLLNLSMEVPHFFSSFETTLEVVHSEISTRNMGRERFRYYQERGYPLRHYDIQPELALA